MRIDELRVGCCLNQIWDLEDCVTHRRSDTRALHLIQDFTDLFQVLDMTTVWVKGTHPIGAIRKWFHDNFVCRARVNFEMQVPSDGILPRLQTSSSEFEKKERTKRTIGNTFTFDSSHGGNSFRGNSKPSVSIPSPVDMAWPGAIQT